MKTLKFTKEELVQLWFVLSRDEATRGKTAQKNFEAGRRKLLNELKKLEKQYKKQTPVLT